MRTIKLLAMAACLGLTAPAVQAQMSSSMSHGDTMQGTHHMAGHQGGHTGHKMHHGNPPPLGIMGAHRLPKGKFMLTYRYGRMSMGGSRIGTNNVSPSAVATTVPNRFFGMPMQPATLRVVPTEMDMEMHMFGAMYAPSDKVTLMAMLPNIRKKMEALTFAGPAGTTVLGANRMTSEGFGDLSLAATIGLWEGKSGQLNGTIGLSVPTGSTTERDTMLTPMGTLMNMRMAYGMQLGSGTYDLMPAITYSGNSGKFGYGAQLAGVIRLNKNNGYAHGDQARTNLWGSVRAAPWLSLSGRVEAVSTGQISGIDPFIRGPMQGSDPLNYGGEQVNLFVGADVRPTTGALRGHRFSIEAGLPVYQDLNGVQLEREWMVMAGWSKAF